MGNLIFPVTNQPTIQTMKARILTIALAAGAFALVACKPKPDTTKEEVKAGADKVAEGVSQIVEASAEAAGNAAADAGAAVEAAVEEVTPAPAPTTPPAE